MFNRYLIPLRQALRGCAAVYSAIYRSTTENCCTSLVRTISAPMFLTSFQPCIRDRQIARRYQVGRFWTAHLFTSLTFWRTQFTGATWHLLEAGEQWCPYRYCGTECRWEPSRSVKPSPSRSQRDKSTC